MSNSVDIYVGLVNTVRYSHVVDILVRRTDGSYAPETVTLVTDTGLRKDRNAERKKFMDSLTREGKKVQGTNALSKLLDDLFYAQYEPGDVIDWNTLDALPDLGKSNKPDGPVIYIGQELLSPRQIAAYPYRSLMEEANNGNVRLARRKADG